MEVLPEGISAPIKKGPALYEFLLEAELSQYFTRFKNNLKVTHPSQLKFVTEDDLTDLGMSKPEIRRMRKYYDKYFANNYLTKFKKLLTNRKQQDMGSGGNGGGMGSGDILSNRDCVGVSKAPRVPSKHIISPANITVNKELGMGEFGVVQQGVWCNEGERIQVAIKCLVRDRMQTNTIEFLKEAVIMHSIDHPHIVRLFGVVLDMGSLMLVTELAPLRSLLECLKEPAVRASFPVLTLCEFAVQICDGMQYLEAKRFIHRDLAARNILVFAKDRVKISDFGLSRALGQGKDYYQTNFNVNLKLPIAWCAPESISYLRFTSASDVWAYAVTLWEMFSYGFQPWAALTGQQILEAIDAPLCQRLEPPDCCPQEYYALMVECWRHEAVERPRFSEVAGRLGECRPERVQAKVGWWPQQGKPEGGTGEEAPLLGYRVGDVITVLDKVTNRPLWKGVTVTGKTGLFEPSNVVAYLGSDLPSSTFMRSHDTAQSLRNSVRRKLRSEMISAPQGDVKHTGHVGLDGAYFGDLSFLEGGAGRGGSKPEYGGIPTQVVPPYRPNENIEAAPLLLDSHLDHHGHLHLSQTGGLSSSSPALDHEYHEISDEEANHSPPLDMGPSLMAEMQMAFSSLGGPPPPPSPVDHDGSNKTNELRERLNAAVTTHGKGGATNNGTSGGDTTSRNKMNSGKPARAQDLKTLDTAIALANEMSHRSMNNGSGGNGSGHHGHHHGSGGQPLTPSSPTKRKFSFRFPSVGGGGGSITGGGGGGGGGNGTLSSSGGGMGGDGGERGAAAAAMMERRNFAEEAQSTPDLQSKFTHEAQMAYQSLVDSPSPDLSQFASSNPLRLLRSGQLPLIKPRPRTSTLPTNHSKSQPEHKLSNESLNHHTTDVSSLSPSSDWRFTLPATSKTNSGNESGPVHQSAFRSLSQGDENPIPLPPRDRNKPLLLSKPRHTRKHPLIIPPSSLQGTLIKYTTKQNDCVPITPPPTDTTTQPSFPTPNSTSRDDVTEPLYSNQRAQHFDPSSLHFETRIDLELAALDDMKSPDLSPSGSDDRDMVAITHSGVGCGSLEHTAIQLLQQQQPQLVDVVDGVVAGGRLQRHHVSCEDLLEFADTKPSARERGDESDEVRIMSKVLGKDYNAVECVKNLEFTDWDVIKAIKLCRLQKVVVGAELNNCNDALEATGWDVTKAAQWILQQDSEVQV